MSILGKYFRTSKNRNNGEGQEENIKYPIDILTKYYEEGKRIGIDYLNQSLPRDREWGKIVHPPNRDSFDFGDSSGFHKVHFDETDFCGNRNALGLIVDEEGNELYKNEIILSVIREMKTV